MKNLIITVFLLLPILTFAQFTIDEIITEPETILEKGIVTGGIVKMVETVTGRAVKISIFKRNDDIFPTMTIDVEDPYNTYETSDEFRCIFFIGEKKVKVVNRTKNNNSGRYVFQIAGKTLKAMKKGEFKQIILFTKDASEYTRVKLNEDSSAYIRKMIEYTLNQRN